MTARTQKTLTAGTIPLIAIMTAVFALDGYKVDSSQIMPITVVTAEDFQ